MEKVNNFRENLHETIKIQHKKESKRTDDINVPEVCFIQLIQI